MDISVRDWMIIIGGLLIVAVLLDGYRRMRDPARVRMSLKPVAGEGESDDVSLRSELPNGGARVIDRDDEPADFLMQDAPDSDLQDREPPLLTEPAPEPLSGVSATDSAPGETLDMLSGVSVEKTESPAPEVDPEVFMLHVVARDDAGFTGDDILQVLLAFEMRFGEMNFFHRHEEAAGRGSVLFSVANMMQPGIFDIDAMSEFSTPGLTFFATLPGPADMNRAFDLMTDTARGVAENLGGDLLDETRSVATRQTLEHMRQRLRDLERRILTQNSRRA